MTSDARPGPIELAEEQVEITKREVERGRIMVRTRVEERDEVVEIALRQGEVTVERVPLGVPIDAVPVAHEEDGVLIIPVVEEQLVVTTRLILKEEIRITRRTHTEVVREPVQPAFRAGRHRAAGRPPHAADPQHPGKESRSMTDRTLTAMYDTRGAAESARDQLVGIGVARDAIIDPWRRGRYGRASDRCERGQGLLGQPGRSLHAGRRSPYLCRGPQARQLYAQRARARRARGGSSRYSRKLRADRLGRA